MTWLLNTSEGINTTFSCRVTPCVTSPMFIWLLMRFWRLKTKWGASSYNHWYRSWSALCLVISLACEMSDGLIRPDDSSTGCVKSCVSMQLEDNGSSCCLVLFGRCDRSLIHSGQIDLEPPTHFHSEKYIHIIAHSRCTYSCSNLM